MVAMAKATTTMGNRLEQALLRLDAAVDQVETALAVSQANAAGGGQAVLPGIIDDTPDNREEMAAIESLLNQAIALLAIHDANDKTAATSTSKANSKGNGKADDAHD